MQTKSVVHSGDEGLIIKDLVRLFTQKLTPKIPFMKDGMIKIVFDKLIYRDQPT